MYRNILDCGMSGLHQSAAPSNPNTLSLPSIVGQLNRYSLPHSESYGNLLRRIGIYHRLNMDVDLQSLFGLHVTSCAQLYSLAETPHPPRIWTCITTRALLVSKDRQHLFVTLALYVPQFSLF
jgi:hypothetical protein